MPNGRPTRAATTTLPTPFSRQMQLEPFPIPSWIVCGAGTGGTGHVRPLHPLPEARYPRLRGRSRKNSAFYDSYYTGDDASTCEGGSGVEGIGRPRGRAIVHSQRRGPGGPRARCRQRSPPDFLSESSWPSAAALLAPTCSACASSPRHGGARRAGRHRHADLRLGRALSTAISIGSGLQAQRIDITPLAAALPLLFRRRPLVAGKPPSCCFSLLRSGKSAPENTETAADFLADSRPNQVCTGGVLPHSALFRRGKHGSACEIRNVVKRFGDFTAVNGVSIGVLRLANSSPCWGPSGCGKTTLLADAGGSSPAAGPARSCWMARTCRWCRLGNRPVHTVFQSYALFPHMTVRDNIAFRSTRRWAADRIATQVDELLEDVRLTQFGSRFPHELSVASASAWPSPAPSAGMLVPSAAGRAAVGAGRQAAREMQIELINLQREVGITSSVYVTHDKLARHWPSHRIAATSAGSVQQLDIPNHLLLPRKTGSFADFIGQCNVLEAKSSPLNADGTMQIEIRGCGEMKALAPQGAQPGQKGWWRCVRKRSSSTASCLTCPTKPTSRGVSTTAGTLGRDHLHRGSGHGAQIEANAAQSRLRVWRASSDDDDLVEIRLAL